MNALLRDRLERLVLQLEAYVNVYPDYPEVTAEHREAVKQLTELLDRPEPDEFARSLAASVLRGTPRDHPSIGWEEALQVLARAVLSSPKGASAKSAIPCDRRREDK